MEPSGKVSVVQLRNLVRSYIDKHLYKTALFWAEKAMSLSNDELQDVYWFAQALFYTKQYERAVHALISRGLHENNLACRYLVGKCYAECKKWQEALDVLEMEQKYLKTNLSSELWAGTASKKLEAAVNLLRGLVYDAMDNGPMACDCYKEALRNDVHCYEAFDQLTSHHMLSPNEELEFYKSLPFEEQCLPEEIPLMKYLYEMKLQDSEKSVKLPTPCESVSSSLDVAVCMAEKQFSKCDFQLCYKMSSQIMQKDPLHSACLPLHISCMVELKKPNELFFLAHKLVDNYPDQAVSWYAVGSYYFLISKYEAARRFLCKATTIDRNFGHAWIGFGHAFAIEGEHDQAMAAYFTASRLMPGAYQPLLYVGIEYNKTNNPKLAERFFNQALAIAPDDPTIKHELGQIAFQNGNYVKAEKCFKEALEKVQSLSAGIILATWEPLVNNLGHVIRKQGRYEEALEYHQQALVLVPQNSDTLSAIGFIYSLLGNYEQAISYFHKALSLRKDDTFSVQMLGQTLEQFSLAILPDEPEEQVPLSSNVVNENVRGQSMIDTSIEDVSMET
ncbi:cell division cycle protein 16 homolog [Dendronephthya gigantea]|uniref:cell division cycle protein 16 homolog n=1 Tax=Dendronephthya gigantea TaxID=151771 RepID=UPI00106B2546|nr:cell division cycle protein 16 homolog [Dendronephthya gigantea]